MIKNPFSNGMIMVGEKKSRKGEGATAILNLMSSTLDFLDKVDTCIEAVTHPTNKQKLEEYKVQVETMYTEMAEMSKGAIHSITDKAEEAGEEAATDVVEEAVDVVEEVTEEPEEVVAPFRWRGGPGNFQAAGDRVGAFAAPEAALPAEPLLLNGSGLWFRAHKRRIAGSMTFAEGVTTGDECDGFLIVHRDAAERIPDVLGCS